MLAEALVTPPDGFACQGLPAAYSCAGSVETLPGPGGPLESLITELKAAFASEKAKGIVIDSHQDPSSFQTLNERVLELMAEYSSDASDWKRYMAFNNLHYIRHLLEECDDFELLVRIDCGGCALA